MSTTTTINKSTTTSNSTDSPMVGKYFRVKPNGRIYEIMSKTLYSKDRYNIRQLNTERIYKDYQLIRWINEGWIDLLGNDSDMIEILYSRAKK